MHTCTSSQGSCVMHYWTWRCCNRLLICTSHFIIYALYVHVIHLQMWFKLYKCVYTLSVCCGVCISVVWSCNPMKFTILHLNIVIIYYCDVLRSNEFNVLPSLNLSCVYDTDIISLYYLLFFANFELSYKLGLYSPDTWSTSLQREGYCWDSLGIACVFLYCHHFHSWKSRFVSIPLSSVLCHHLLSKIDPLARALAMAVHNTCLTSKATEFTDERALLSVEFYASHFRK